MSDNSQSISAIGVYENHRCARTEERRALSRCASCIGSISICQEQLVPHRQNDRPDEQAQNAHSNEAAYRAECAQKSRRKAPSVALNRVVAGDARTRRIYQK